MPAIEIRDSLVIVEERPYSALEVLVSGTMSGYVRATATSGFSGRLILQESRTVYEYPGILVVGELLRSGENKLVLNEGRKGLVLRALGKSYANLHEVGIKLENVKANLTMLFTPRRLVLETSNAVVQVIEGFAFVEVAIRPREQVVGARATQVQLE